MCKICAKDNAGPDAAAAAIAPFITSEKEMRYGRTDKHSNVELILAFMNHCQVQKVLC